MVEKSEVCLEENGDICLNGTVVGYLGWEENMLVDIFVDSEYRGQGIGTIAVEKMVEKIEEEGYDEIQTTTVVSPAMERVLEKVGFEQYTVEEPRFETDGIDLPEDKIPVKEEVKWKFYCSN